jgi:F0F1-type ATP synthase delta subunit
VAVHKKGPAEQPSLTLPVLIFGIVEIRRLKRELETLEEFIHQAAIREPGKQPPLPRVSRLLEALAADNNLQLLQGDHRAQLKDFLAYAEQHAPNVHISFAIDPSSAFTAKIVTWLRANIHQHALMEVGLQPTIAAGCIVRTNNKIFDFSLRERFADAGTLLVKALQAVGNSAARVSAVAAPAAAAPAVLTPAVHAQAIPVVTNVEDVAAQLAVPTAAEAAAAQAAEVAATGEIKS